MKNEKLFSILCEFGQICGGIMCGEIPFTFNGDALMCALKPGHPGDIMDDFVAMVYNRIDEDPKDNLDAVKQARDGFAAIMKCFGVNQIEAPLEKLDEYIAEVEGKSKKVKTIKKQSQKKTAKKTAKRAKK